MSRSLDANMRHPGRGSRPCGDDHRIVRGPDADHRNRGGQEPLEGGGARLKISATGMASPLGKAGALPRRSNGDQPPHPVAAMGRQVGRADDASHAESDQIDLWGTGTLQNLADPSVETVHMSRDSCLLSAVIDRPEPAPPAAREVLAQRPEHAAVGSVSRNKNDGKMGGSV